MANGPRLMSEQPEHRITSDDVLRILEAAEGRCHYCGSLAVEKRPPGPWNRVGRRIGTLHHAEVRFLGGSNTPDNLVWACMWCSTWPLEEERRPGAVDRGGYFPWPAKSRTHRTSFPMDAQRAKPPRWGPSVFLGRGRGAMRELRSRSQTGAAASRKTSSILALP